MLSSVFNHSLMTGNTITVCNHIEEVDANETKKDTIERSVYNDIFPEMTKRCQWKLGKEEKHMNNLAAISSDAHTTKFNCQLCSDRKYLWIISMKDINIHYTCTAQEYTKHSTLTPLMSKTAITLGCDSDGQGHHLDLELNHWSAHHHHHHSSC